MFFETLKKNQEQIKMIKQRKQTILKSDEFYMKKALLLAKQAKKNNEIPVGAIIISQYGDIIGSGYNRVERYQCQGEHAEMRAIKKACKKLKNWRLDRCTLYVTLEPCMMCISLCALSRIERIVYGAESPIFGHHLDKEGILALYTKQIKNITSKVLAEEAALLLKNFFSSTRKGNYRE